MKFWRNFLWVIDCQLTSIRLCSVLSIVTLLARAGGSAQLSNDDVRPFVIDDIAIAIVIDVIDVIAASAITSDGIVLADIVAAAGRESGDSARSRAGS